MLLGDGFLVGTTAVGYTQQPKAVNRQGNQDPSCLGRSAYLQDLQIKTKAEITNFRVTAPKILPPKTVLLTVLGTDSFRRLFY